MDRLQPFWLYYGSKWRAAPLYPPPIFPTVVEPFAGSAGYSMLHYDRDVVLVEKYPVVAGVWRYLIAASHREILQIPIVDAVDDLPSWVPQEARWLVGFKLTTAAAGPRKTLSVRNRQARDRGSSTAGWSAASRDRCAMQVDYIRHWKVVEGDYFDVDNRVATWFVDPPYQGAGVHYARSSRDIDFDHLAAWCRALRGQVIVCENDGASWLPFRPFKTIRSSGQRGDGRRESVEVTWENTPVDYFTRTSQVVT